ncbi:MAG TPA: SRPBCC family protein [bacterium]|nr:SRPBCC family protein [bacterium]
MAVLKISRKITVAAPRDLCYAFWSDPRNFKATFDVVSEVADISESQSRWTLNLPSGKQEEVVMVRAGSPPDTLAWVSSDSPITFNTGFAFAESSMGGTDMALEAEIGMGGLQGMMLPAMRPVIEQKIDDVLSRFRQAVEAQATA